ncbi:large neutral amino acids transporter small subunit 4-like [Hyla sarda]|uniref:large neutral amino acids transporter small subunit 4-like n=1 Tax=Hyla sarda TaxID=327740 RepID=UPI0024C3E9CF|nr:large neutral amino acids transporter small subunit 4-like [Hyla sarda]
MGRILRMWVLSSALVETLLFSGCLLGWSSLSPILMDVGVLSLDCHSGLEQSEAGSNDSALEARRMEVVSSLPGIILGSKPREPHDSCTVQERYLNLAFTVGTFFAWGAFLPLQLLLGYAHIRSLRQIGGALVSISYLMLMYCFTNPQNLSLFLPFALIAQGLGGSCVLFSSLLLPQILQNVGSLFPSLVIASFSASATIFTIIKVIYYSGAPIVPIILGYGAMSCVVLVNSTLCWSLNPAGKEEDNIYSVSLRLNCYEAMKKKKKPQEENWCQKSLKLKFQESLRDRERILSQRRTLSFKRPNVLAPSPVMDSLTSPTFILHLLSDSTLLTWVYFYVSSINAHLQIQAEDQEGQSDIYSSVFGALQMLGLFAAPLISILLYNHRIRKRPIMRIQTTTRNSHKSACGIKRLSAVYALRGLVIVGFGISCLIPSLQVQVVGFILHVVMRTSMFLVSSTLYLCVFPGHHYGALLGIGTFISSILSLLQHPLFMLFTGPLQRNPFWIHVMFLALSLGSFALPLHLIIKNKGRPHHPLSRPIHLHPVTPPSKT